MASRRLVYQQGDHICTLYSSSEEQLQAAVEYIKAGLNRGEQCLYVCGEHTPDELRKALQAAGINVKEEEARGALSLATKAEAHLKDGHFNASNMISFLHQAVKDALDAGFNGLCAAGDMGWVTDGAAGTEGLAEYESASTNSMPTTGHSGFANTIANRFRRNSLTIASQLTGSSGSKARLRWRTRFMKNQAARLEGKRQPNPKLVARSIQSLRKHLQDKCTLQHLK